MAAIHRTKTIRKEAAAAARAGVSSFVATLVDGALYQIVLAVTMQTSGAKGSYPVAAAMGALAGGITNFMLNRFWAFRSKEKGLAKQAAQYAAGSLTTLLVLEAVLFVLVEKIGIDARTAWLPAKAIAWAFFSYPYQRLVVFSTAQK
jgi:putative flippase GtrA